MELNKDSIEGDWANIDDNEYFVYTKASIMGLCIIGEHEPCFSVSTFFSKEDDKYASQYEKFSSLLSGLKELVEETENNQEGGEQPMDENFENNLGTPAEEPVVETAPEVEVEVEETPVEQENFEVEPAEVVPAEVEEPAVEPVDFEALQNRIAELETANAELTTNYENAQSRIAELEQALSDATAATENANGRITELENSISQYEAERAQAEEVRKNQLIEKYEKVIDEEEIAKVREEVSNFSYSELESKLAISFANKQMANAENIEVIPQPEPPVNQFALLIEKYRKN